MPEYAALIYHYEQASSDGDEAPPSVDEVEGMFLRMERAGIGKIH